MKYYVYIIKSADGDLYTGVTKDLNERLRRHNTGRGCKYTKNKIPFRLVYYEERFDFKAALERERQIKSYSRYKKNLLIERQKI